jgi:hypothetical protein
VFFAVVAAVVLRSPQMFTGRHARRHRLCGLAYLLCLFAGLVDRFTPFIDSFAWDVMLGLAGTAATVTAALDFKHHKHVKNVASGVLDEDATVTDAEMLEHAFYQVSLHGSRGVEGDGGPWRCLQQCI